VRATDEVRMVCVGDSFTEGMSDELRPDGRPLGWADRVARALAEPAAREPGGPGEPREPRGLREASRRLLYANLAVRGKLLDQVVEDQLDAAISFAPTLATFHAGPNDVLRRGTDMADLSARYERAVARLAGAGGRLLLFTSIGRAGGEGRLGRLLAERFARFNDNVRLVGPRHGATVVDLEPVDVLTDRRVWHVDRLHLNAEGHTRVAAAVLEQLGVTDPDLLGGSAGWWRQPLPAPAAARRRDVLAEDLRWGRTHLLPWVGRRLRGRSSGDGRAPKDPVLRPVVGDG
jgi:lysophospholipase L1-like esterase